MKQLKLIKFDTFYPHEHLVDLQNKNKSEIQMMDFDEYYKWIISLRSNYSDFYTHNLSEVWDGLEVIINDNIFLSKLHEKIIKSKGGFKAFKHNLKKKFKKDISFDRLHLICEIIETQNPDVIFLREPLGIDNYFWSRYRSSALLVTRVSCPISHVVNWNPLISDVTFTGIGLYKDFLKTQGISIHQIQDGFDERILNEIKSATNCNLYDISFVGLLGTVNQSLKSRTLNEIASHLNVNWWGPKGDEIKKYDRLLTCWRGYTTGIEMFEVYKNSKIVFNDYVDVANGEGVNQRIKEVMGVGTLLLTRESKILSERIPSDCIVTYSDSKDFIRKAKYYLKNDCEREEIAIRGQKFILNNYNYKDIVKKIEKILYKTYKERFQNLKNRSEL